MVTTIPPKFPNTYCSQCGREFGPGDHGYSHCDSHSPVSRADLDQLRTAETVSAQAAAALVSVLTLKRTVLTAMLEAGKTVLDGLPADQRFLIHFELVREVQPTMWGTFASGWNEKIKGKITSMDGMTSDFKLWYREATRFNAGPGDEFNRR